MTTRCAPWWMRLNTPSSSRPSRIELERLIYRRMLVECRFALTNIIVLHQNPQLGDYVRDQIEQVLGVDQLSDEQLVQLGVAIHAMENRL